MRPIDADAFEKYAWSNPDIEVDGEPYISPSAVQNFATDHPIVIDQPNDPLTLEQLREMDAPVWCACKPIEGGNGYWCLCQRGHIITPAGSIFDVNEIPHWVFYRRPPEGEEDSNV